MGVISFHFFYFSYHGYLKQRGGNEVDLITSSVHFSNTEYSTKSSTN